ncbi:unnamed protein product [Brachionus calyciflorus]|uniref:Uncharacterized protein n=1 Tax=Brachionus calyciflorus TaxID=104777 RepID=A0A814NVU3_9BILA|nr:unnamed protein product [Brachionus calyciflorus]
MGNHVVITSRSQRSVQKTIEDIKSEPSDLNIDRSSCKKDGMVLDIDDQNSYSDETTEFDVLFCLPGFCIAKYFKDLEITEFQSQINTNLLGVVRMLMYYRKNNTKPFTFVAANSTTAGFSFPGYSCYSASKSVLDSFHESVHMQLSREKIDFKLLNCGTMKTNGLRNENKCKPRFTIDFEYNNTVSNTDEVAKYYINLFRDRKRLSYDWFTYFVTIRSNCEKRIDYLLFPLSVFVLFTAKCLVEIKFRKARID